MKSIKNISQHDSNDCGPACLKMIMSYYGFNLSIAKIRQMTKTDKEGTSIYGILEAAKQIGFYAKAFKAKTGKELSEICNFPAIAHIYNENGNGHFVVIEKVVNNRVVVIDPAKGKKIYEYELFIKRWSKKIILLFPSKEVISEERKENIVREFIFQEKALILKIFLVSLFISFFGIITTYYYKIAMDSSWIKTNIFYFIKISVLFFLVSILKILFELIRERMVLLLGNKLQSNLILKYCKHLLNLPLEFLQANKNGEILSRLYDITKIRTCLSDGIVTLLMDCVMLVVGSIVLILFKKTIFLIAFCPLVFYVIIIRIFNKTLEKQNYETMENDAKLNSILVETLDGIETIKGFNIEKRINNELQYRLEKLMNSITKLGNIKNNYSVLEKIVEMVIIFLILLIGSYEVTIQKLTQGEFFTVYALLTYYLAPIQRIVNLQVTFNSALVAIERLYDIIDTETEKNDDIIECPINLKGDIVFKDVDFRYGTRKLVLKQLNLKIQYGSKVALVGECGVGKSTVAKLLMAFYSCENGKISIGQYDIKKINIKELRDKIAYISQSVFFFSGTVYDNFRVIREGITDEEIEQLCKNLYLHEFISALPLGYNTVLEENASNLSGGQKQRLAIARALLKKPQILIMDEATSNMDGVSERTVDWLLRQVEPDITIIVIAHRFSTIKKCDRIFFMKNGEIVEEGSHMELIDRRGYYYEMYEKS